MPRSPPDGDGQSGHFVQVGDRRGAFTSADKQTRHRGVIRSNHYYCGSSPKCEADRCIVTGTGQSALSLLLYNYLHNSADRGIGAGTGQTVLSLLLYTYLLTFWAAPTIVMVASNHASVQYKEH